MLRSFRIHRDTCCWDRRFRHETVELLQQSVWNEVVDRVQQLMQNELVEWQQQETKTAFPASHREEGSAP